MKKLLVIFLFLSTICVSQNTVKNANGSILFNDSGDITTVGTIETSDTLKTNTISPYSGTTTTFPQSVSLGDSTQLDKVNIEAKIRQTANYGVITANDTMNLQTVNITPTSNDVTANTFNINMLNSNINKNSTNKWYNSTRNLYSSLNNLNDSTNLLQNVFVTSVNNGRYSAGIYGVHSTARNICVTASDSARSKVVTAFNSDILCTNSNVLNAKSITNETFGFNGYFTLGSYYTTTIDTAKGTNIVYSINARTGGYTTSINTLKGYNLDISSTYTTGTRTVQNMYGLYLKDRSGLSGVVNDYGIYVSGFKNNFIDGTTSLGDTLFLENKADTITGTINLSDIGGEDLSNSTTPLNTIYCQELSLEEGANAAMGLDTLVNGVIVINTTKVTANSRIFLTLQNCDNCGYLWISARTAGTSFTVSSSNVLDDSTVAWMIVEPN